MERGRKPCAAAGEGAMGAMKVGGGSDEKGGGEAVEEEEGGGEDEERVWGFGGDEAAGRAGGRWEKREAEDGTEGGTAPPVTAGLVLGAAAAGGELAKALDGAFVLAVGAAEVEVETDAAAAATVAAAFTSGDGALSEPSQAGLESEFADGAAGGELDGALAAKA